MNYSSKKVVTIDPPFIFKSGDTFEDPLTIAYETSGTLNDKKDNAILVTTGLSPSAHICSSTEDTSPGWWEKIVGEGNRKSCFNRKQLSIISKGLNGSLEPYGSVRGDTNCTRKKL